MATKKRSRGNPIPLIIEEHPADYDGYPFITLIQYNKKHFLAIVDNTDAKTIKAYILDLCGPEGVNEEEIIKIAAEWYDNSRDQYPISFEFSKRGVSETTMRIYKSYTIEYVTRIIGPLPKFEMSDTVSVKRRRRKSVPSGMEIHTPNVVQLR